MLFLTALESVLSIVLIIAIGVLFTPQRLFCRQLRQQYFQTDNEHCPTRLDFRFRAKPP